MDHYIDIKDEIFEALKEHVSDCLVLNRDLADQDLEKKNLEEENVYRRLQVGDSLKLYHPSDPEEALRVQIEKKEESLTEMTLHCSLLEWVFQIETELDDLLREEQALLNDFF